MFTEVSLADGDTTTLLEDFQAQAIAPHGLAFRGRIVKHALSGFVALGRRDQYEANQGSMAKPLITITSFAT